MGCPHNILHTCSFLYNESTCGADALVLHGLMRACAYLHVHSHHLGVVIKVMTDDRSTKVGHYVATLAVVAS